MYGYARVRIGMLTAMLAGAAKQPASADVVSLKRGNFVFEAGVGNLDITGNHGFSLRAGVNLDGGRFEAYSRCLSVTPCPPGTEVELDAFWGGNAVQGSATFRDVIYEDVGAFEGDSSAEIAFSGSVTMPEASDPPVSVSVTVPFDFAGAFAYGLNGPEPQRVLLSGGGRVTLTLQPIFDGEAWAWAIERAVFEFTRVETR
jgi:hypothetical protein